MHGALQAMEGWWMCPFPCRSGALLSAVLCPGSGRRSSQEPWPRALPDPCIAIPLPSVHGRRNTRELPLLPLTCVLVHPRFPLI